MKNIPRKKTVEKVFAAVCKKYGIKPGKFTKTDFYRICKGENILLLNNKAALNFFEIDKLGEILGFYAKPRKLNIRFIYLRCFFQKKFYRSTAFHELGHHFLQHSGGLNLSNISEHSKCSEQELEADYFAELSTGLKVRGEK